MTYVTQTRGWTDFDGNRHVLDANGNVQFNEVIGGTSNFGGLTSRPDPELARAYNWEYGASIQHELMPRLGVTVGYHRRNFYNLDVTDNMNLSPDEWNPFTIVTPDDGRLPTAGTPITMYSLNENKRGTATDNVRTYSSINTSVYNGFEFSANARFSQGAVSSVASRRPAGRPSRAMSATTRTACASATRYRPSAPPSSCPVRTSCRTSSS